MPEKVFSGVKAFISPKFTITEIQRLKALLTKNGGEVCNKETKECVHIVHTFDDDLFASLMQRKRTVYGIQCVYDSQRHSRPLPGLDEEGPVAVFARFMEDMMICCTGLTPQEREEIHQCVGFMGGKVDQNLTNEVTHLISVSTNTKKYKSAHMIGVPVVNKQWILDCWEKKSLLSIDNYILPPFLDCVISVTNMDTEMRSQMQRHVLTYGGKYEEDLKKICTHLVSPRAHGKKYLGARKWGLIVVNPQWIQDCVEHKRKMEEDLYPVPEEGETTKEALAQINSETSRITGSNAPSQHSNESCPATQVAAPDHKRPNEPNEGDGKQQPPGLPLSRGETEEDECMFLDGCKIFLSGYSATQEQNFVQMITIGGGTRLKQYDNCVTHFIVDYITQESVSPLATATNTPKIVNSQWLQECFRLKKLLNETAFVVVIPSSLMPSPSLTRKSSRESRTGSNGTSTLHSHSTEDQSLHSDPTITGGFGDIPLTFSPYEQSRLFSTLNILGRGGWTEAQNSDIRRLVSENGGLYLDEQGVVPHYINYIVCPHGCNVGAVLKDIEHTRQPRPAIVSYDWLTRCLETEKLLDSTSCPLFAPLPSTPPYISMLGLGISISGFVEEQRVNLIALIKLLGAKYNDKFSKKESHIICKEPTGEKYGRALLWKTAHIVSKEWLYQCASQGYHVDESQHIVRGSSSTSNDATSTVVDFDYSIPVVDSEDSHKEEFSHGPVLPGVTMLISKKIPASRLSELEQMISWLGASYVYIMNKQVTHCVYEGKNDAKGDGELKSIRKGSTQVVSPLWIEKCYQAQKHLPESDFPPTLNPKMNLGIVGLPQTGKIMQKSRGESPAQVLDKKRKRTSTNGSDNLQPAPKTPRGPKTPEEKRRDEKLFLEMARMPKPAEDTPLIDRVNARLSKSPAKNAVVACTPLSDQINYGNPKTVEHDDFLDGDVPATAPEVIHKNSLKRKLEEPKPSKVTPKKKREGIVVKDSQEPVSIQEQKDAEDDGPLLPVVTANSQDSIASDKDDLVKDGELQEKLEALFQLIEAKPSSRKVPSTVQCRSRQEREKDTTSSPIKTVNIASEIPERKAPRKSNRESEDSGSEDTSSKATDDDFSSTFSSQYSVFVSNAQEHEKRARMKANMKAGGKGREVDSEEGFSRLKMALHENDIEADASTQMPARTHQNGARRIPLMPAPADLSPIVEYHQAPHSPTPPQRPARSSVNKVQVVLSNVTDTVMKEKLVGAVQQLGGQVIPEIVPSFTHVVTPSITASMKCYSACASGKWLLKPSFLEESSKYGYFVDEIAHEWSAADCPQAKKDVQCVANGARSCRERLARQKELNGPQQGLFSGFKVICFLDPTSAVSWKTIIVAGGGTVVDLKPPFHGVELQEVLTHAFFEKRKLKGMSPTVDQLRKANIPCLDISFLRQYVVRAGDLSMSDYDISQKAKEIL